MNWRADSDDCLRPPQLLPALKGPSAATTEWVAVEAADVHGNYRCVDTVKNPLKTAFEWSDTPIPRDETFREDSHQFATRQFRMRGA